MKIKNLINIAKALLSPDALAYLIFFITARCNARCKYCFYYKNINEDKDELKLEEFEKISQNIVNLPYLLLSGGEPFLREDISEICLCFHRNSKIKFLSIPTNALLPERIIKNVCFLLQKTDDLFIRIALSLDAIGEDHNELRGVPGNFEKLVETYRGLDDLRKRYKNLNIDAATVFSHYNQNQIEEIFKKAKELFQFDNHSLGLIRLGGFGFESLDIDVSIFEKMIKKIISEKKKKENRPLSPIFRAVTDLQGEMLIRTLKENKQIFPCTAGVKMLVINETGTVFPCEPMFSRPMGNLREFNYNLKELLSSRQSRDVINLIKRTNCYCTWECAINANLFFNRKAYPLILKRAIKNLKNLKRS